MIHYDLRCGDGHTFDGWFRSSSAFDQQAASGMLDCPVCASTHITRALMAPRLNRGVAAPVSEAPSRPGDAATPALPSQRSKVGGSEGQGSEVGGSEVGAREVAVQAPDAMAVAGAAAMPDQMRAVLQRIRAEIEQKCDYVGTKFADEARAMHYGEQKRRSIYGETSPDQAEALAEEGIEVARIPWVPRADG